MILYLWVCDSHIDFRGGFSLVGLKAGRLNPGDRVQLALFKGYPRGLISSIGSQACTQRSPRFLSWATRRLGEDLFPRMSVSR